MPRSIGLVISRHPGLLHDLQTVYGAEDLYNLLEVIAVDAHNRRVLAEPR
ncbi:transcription elongation factor GreA [Achromobacter xylosoxidans]|uniref:Transcription elongation factor GreA n=1 Tax=Alcaligenes xylosoxydans xylosoxydans TaxID=85698 RepID=A0A424WB87_ALCXX|nr:transcription elongation factor GreA [Achromobacter xylosoxidans]MBD0868764.1 transcription elongation factor GreA [Achromobacter xylosoxidans]QNP88991.1 transcription elongation factor GreA [Achromobacter xylosoxidans]RPJ90418.1 transcription elongation factor GreA [Achromobacter xylosoxidans]